jgi:hypothetical protein
MVKIMIMKGRVCDLSILSVTTHAIRAMIGGQIQLNNIRWEWAWRILAKLILSGKG